MDFSVETVGNFLAVYLQRLNSELIMIIEQEEEVFAFGFDEMIRKRVFLLIKSLLYLKNHKKPKQSQLLRLLNKKNTINYKHRND